VAARILAVLLVYLFQTTGIAASELDIIELRNRPAEEMIPLVRPMLDAGESVSGTGFQLILKASAARQKQIRGLVSRLDLAAAQLMISVFQGSERDLSSLNINAGVSYKDSNTNAQIGTHTATNKGAGISVHANNTNASASITGTRARMQDNPVYRLRITEGTTGYIETGQSIPYFSNQGYGYGGRGRLEPGVEFKDVTSGFYVLPRLSGTRVILDISPYRDTLDVSRPGAINTRRAATTISGQLGEWIPLGGTTTQAKHSGKQTGTTYSTQDRNSESIWIKAEQVQ